MSFEYSSEYALIARDDQIGQWIKFQKFPELNMKYLGYENNLCHSNYSSAMCVWEGDLNITISVNGKTITINDHDSRREKVNIIISNGFQYIFQGLRPHVENRSRDQTYLVFRIIKVPEHWHSPIQVGPWETLSTKTLYNINPV